MKNRRSVCIISEVEGYGTRTHTLDLGQRILERGFALELLNCRYDIFGELPADWDRSRVSVLRSDLSAYDKSTNYAQWMRLLRSFESRVVILQRSSMHFGTHPFLIACWKKFGRVNYIQHFANEVPPTRTWRDKLKRYSKSIYADSIVVVSEFMRESLTRDWHYPSRKIECVFNGVDLSKFARDRALGMRFRAQSGTPDDVVVFGVLARLDVEKGVDSAVAAYGRLVARNPGWRTRLVLIGDGGERSNLERLAAELGIGDKVVFCGFMKDPRPALFAVDILVAPSRIEAFGLSVIEGIAAGCLPVVFAVGGLTEIVTSKDDGWLVPPDDIQALSLAMETAAKTPIATRERMVRNAMQRVASRFDAERNYQRILDIFRIGRPPARD